MSLRRFLGCCAALFYAIACAAGTSSGPAASTAQDTLPPVVVESTAIPGAFMDADKIPGHVQSLGAEDLSREGRASLTDALNGRLGSVSINDNLDDPFQPDILFRGFEASPVLGTPQGLAVYQNGVRINEAFGDTVNWDLFPDIAIQRVEIVSSDPVYGLNALAGGMSVTMKNGFDYHGTDLELSGGSFAQHAAAAQYGASGEHVAVYLAGNVLDQTGWREFARDVLRQFYSAFSARGDSLSGTLTYTHADNRLNGQGAAPVQELAVNRSLVFTGPQSNLNKLDFLTFNGSWTMSEDWSAQGVLYYREYRQRLVNGNTTLYTACASAAASGVLCQADGTTPVTDAAGRPLQDPSQGGTQPIGQNDFQNIATFSRGAALQITGAQRLAGHENAFSAGATFDYALVDFASGEQLGVINPDLLVLPSNVFVNTPEGGAFTATPVGLKTYDQHIGLYAKESFDVTRAFTVTASGRYNIAAIDLRDQRGSYLTGDNRFTHFNPALGFTYKLTSTLTGYGGFAQNTRTPTPSEIECSDPARPCLLPSNLAGDPPTLRQVVARTVEAGLRGSIQERGADSGKFTWNAGLFRILSTDDIYGIATSVSTGYFQNIGSTRRQGLEAGLDYARGPFKVYANFSFVDATFRSPLTLPSASNPYQDANGDIHVVPGDRLPGIARQRFKTGIDYRVTADFTAGASLSVVGNQNYFGDEANYLPPIPGYHVVGLHGTYQAGERVQLFGSIANLLNARYATYGILGNPTGVGAPGIPPAATGLSPGVDTRFQSPAAPFAVFGGVRLTF